MQPELQGLRRGVQSESTVYGLYVVKICMLLDCDSKTVVQPIRRVDWTAVALHSCWQSQT